MSVSRSITAVTATALLPVLFVLAQELPGELALNRAIQRSDLDAVKRAIQAGANVNFAERSGATPLMHAAIYSNEACVRLLLDSGADPNAVNQAAPLP